MSPYGELELFVLLASVLLDCRIYPVPRSVTLVAFRREGIEVPGCEVIGSFYYAGSRRYQWRDLFWGEYDLHTTKCEEAAMGLLYASNLDGDQRSAAFHTQVLLMLRMLKRDTVSGNCLIAPLTHDFIRAIYPLP